ncbi:MAG: M56 family metallopeptidase, partial [Acetatifactor sp.]|nr:M56 family metallopeptidase [Acetatifactor sp.]
MVKMSLPLMSLHGGILIGVILLLRAICKNRLPRVTFLILWGMALLRLLVPFSIPARFSIYSLISQQEIWQDNCTDVDNGIFMGNSIDAGLGWLETAENWHSLCNDIDLGIIITIIRWTGTLLCALLFFAIYYICMRRFCSSLPVKNEYVQRWVSGHPLRRPMAARQSDRVSTPLTYGILKPVILLPGELEQLEEEKMEYILQHEYRHICRFDGIWKFLMVPAACLHWFNPMVWIMYFVLSRDIEMACDESVLKHFGAAAKQTYARILLEMSEENRIFKPLYNAFGRNATEERIRAIMKYKKKTFAAVITAIVLVTMVACGS